MSVRRGSSRTDLQTVTVGGWGWLNFEDDQQTSSTLWTDCYDLRPEPGGEWAVHEVQQSYSIRPRNPTDEEPAVSPYVAASLTFGDEPFEGYQENERLRPDVPGETPGTIGNETWTDWQHVWAEFGPAIQAYSNGSDTQVEPFEGRDVMDYRDDPLHVSDLEELTFVFAADYPADNTVGGGEKGIFGTGVTQVLYEPL